MIARWIGCHGMYRCLFLAVALIAAVPAGAQIRTAPALSSLDPDQDEQQQQQQQQAQQNQTPIRPNQNGRTADSVIGEVGQRQTRDDAARGIAPMARIVNRIQNRIQSRLRNRIDRDYDPQANAAAPFATAEDQARSTGQPRR